MATRGRRTKPYNRPLPLALLLIAMLAFVVSLGTVLRAYAMPVEARTTEPWYGYQSAVGYDFLADVVKGRYYSDTTVHPDQLLKTRVPVDPPVYRRVLISQLTNSVKVSVPYYFRGDRPANIKAKLRVDGQLVLPGFWQKPYPFVQEKTFDINGAELSGTETFVIPVKQLLADMEATKNELKMSIEPMEIHIRPVLEVNVAGLKQLVQVTNNPEFQMALRPSTLEADDTRDNRVDKVLAETQIVPISLKVLGVSVRVIVLRQISLTALFLFLALGVIMFFLRRKKPDGRNLLQKLGPNLLAVRAFELPGDVAIAEVRTAKELVQLQAQTERPVIRVGTSYYLLDGTTCYRYVLTADQTEASDD